MRGLLIYLNQLDLWPLYLYPGWMNSLLYRRGTWCVSSRACSKKNPWLTYVYFYIFEKISTPTFVEYWDLWACKILKLTYKCLAVGQLALKCMGIKTVVFSLNREPDIDIENHFIHTYTHVWVFTFG